LDLKVIVSTVRKTLRELYRRAVQQGSARGETLPEDCFLPHAPRGGEPDLGPYLLRLAPERVLIRGARPLWMKARLTPPS
jgi:hypothetical protein